MSFGLEELENQYGPFSRMVFSRPGRGESGQFSHTELHNAVWHARGLHVNAFVDVRGAVGPEGFVKFPNPCRGVGLHHVGFHPVIVAGLVNARYFPEWLGLVKQEVSSLLDDSSDSEDDEFSKTLALYCKSGRHRSVAGVFILRHCLYSNGWLNPTTSHVTQERERWDGCRGTCDQCRAPHSSRECIEALENAWRLWVAL